MIESLINKFWVYGSKMKKKDKVSTYTKVCDKLHSNMI